MSPDRRPYCVYIMASASGVLYTGSTSDLRRRVLQHRRGHPSRFTAMYVVNRLVYYECTPNSRAAVECERRIKGWSREKKVRLIESMNPGWVDLAASWFPGMSGGDPSLRSG
jgi:putative endonuclease